MISSSQFLFIGCYADCLLETRKGAVVDSVNYGWDNVEDNAQVDRKRPPDCLTLQRFFLMIVIG